MNRLLLVLMALVFSLPGRAAESESAFDRVMRTGVIRCGYYVFPPVTYRDPNTGAMSGFSVDFMNRLAGRAALKVEWAEEVTFGNWVPAMQGKRFDMICTPMWPELPMAKAVLFTRSLFFSGLSPVVRADDARFNEAVTMDRLNQPDVTFVAQEGNMTYNLVKDAFPDARIYALAPEADTSNHYQSLLTKKADVSLTDRNGLHQYMKANDSPLKMLFEDRPVKLQSFPLVVGRGERELADFLNLAIDEMSYSGEIDRILRQWEPEPGRTYLRTAPAFAPPP